MLKEDCAGSGLVCLGVPSNCPGTFKEPTWNCVQVCRIGTRTKTKVKPKLDLGYMFFKKEM